MNLSLLAISLDADDAGRLADFWAQLLDRPVDDGASPDFASIGLSAAGSGTEVWMFHSVPESKVAKNRSHVDLVADDLEKAVARAIDLGAARVGDFDEGGYQWTSLQDPAGNEFDIVAAP